MKNQEISLHSFEIRDFLTLIVRIAMLYLFSIIIIKSIPKVTFLYQTTHLEKYLKLQGIVSVQFSRNTMRIVFQEKVSHTREYQLKLQR